MSEPAPQTPPPPPPSFSDAAHRVYNRARRHAIFMAAALFVAIMFVVLIERMAGHSSIAFGIAIVGLVLANARMLTFNCPNCGKNLFFRGILVVPWPNEMCGRCGTQLAPPKDA